MKKLLFLLVLFAGWLPAQTSRTYKDYKKFNTIIKTNPLVLAWGAMPLTCEARYLREVCTAERQSLTFGFSYLGKNPIADSILANGTGGYRPTVWIKGFRLMFGYRIYFSKDVKAPLGWYIGPWYSYSTAKYSYRNYWLRGAYVQGTQWNLDWVIGKQSRLGKRLTYDLFIGAGYKNNHWEYLSTYKVRGINLKRITGNSYYTSPFKVAAGLNFGWLF
ncbi:MAG TPA: hypothetical protein VI112_09800 [Bacteroidia bacterium]